MSIHPYVHIGFGFILDINDEKVKNNIRKRFPELAEEFSGDDHGMIQEAWGESSISGKYNRITMDLVTDWNGRFTQFVVYSKDRSQELYNKYDGGSKISAFYPEDVTPPNMAEFQQFMDDFEITHPPKIVIWTVWS